MAVQIVDARNPLMYYTEDLMKYASELEVCILLISTASPSFVTHYFILRVLRANLILGHVQTL